MSAAAAVALEAPRTARKGLPPGWRSVPGSRFSEVSYPGDGAVRVLPAPAANDHAPNWDDPGDGRCSCGRGCPFTPGVPRACYVAWSVVVPASEAAVIGRPRPSRPWPAPPRLSASWADHFAPLLKPPPPRQPLRPFSPLMPTSEVIRPRPGIARDRNRVEDALIELADRLPMRKRDADAEHEPISALTSNWPWRPTPQRASRADLEASDPPPGDYSPAELARACALLTSLVAERLHVGTVPLTLRGRVEALWDEAWCALVLGPREPGVPWATATLRGFWRGERALRALERGEAPPEEE